jgi:hypothetical protein
MTIFFQSQGPAEKEPENLLGSVNKQLVGFEFSQPMKAGFTEHIAAELFFYAA